MTVKQLSVFLENKYGTLVKVLSILKEENIQIIASTIADTAEYGIFRIICNNPEDAYNTLKKAGIVVSLCDVFALTLVDKPGMASNVIESFAQEEVSISYLYSFLYEGKGVLIFKTDNLEKAKAIIDAKGYSTLSTL